MPDHSFTVVLRHDSSKLAPILWRSTDPAHNLPELTALLEEQHRAGLQRTTQALEQWRKGLGELKLVEPDVPEFGDCLDASVTGEDVHSGDVKPIAHRHWEYERPGQGGARNADDHSGHEGQPEQKKQAPPTDRPDQEARSGRPLEEHSGAGECEDPDQQDLQNRRYVASDSSVEQRGQVAGVHKEAGDRGMHRRGDRLDSRTVRAHQHDGVLEQRASPGGQFAAAHQVLQGEGRTGASMVDVRLVPHLDSVLAKLEDPTRESDLIKRHVQVHPEGFHCKRPVG